MRKTATIQRKIVPYGQVCENLTPFFNYHSMIGRNFSNVLGVKIRIEIRLVTSFEIGKYKNRSWPEDLKNIKELSRLFAGPLTLPTSISSAHMIQWEVVGESNHKAISVFSNSFTQQHSLQELTTFSAEAPANPSRFLNRKFLILQAVKVLTCRFGFSTLPLVWRLVAIENMDDLIYWSNSSL